jgi:hypothetical protein
MEDVRPVMEVTRMQWLAAGAACNFLGALYSANAPHSPASTDLASQGYPLTITASGGTKML